MKWIAATALLLLALGAKAQDETVRRLKEEASKEIKKEEDTTERAWRTGGIFALNLNQGSLSNWAAGGDRFSLSLNNLTSLYAYYKQGRRYWDNTFDFNLGFLRTSTLGSRKNDDRIDLLSKYGYGLSSDWNVTALFNFRSQLLKGYTYPEDVKTFSSAFLSPAYVLTGVGMDYKPNAEFNLLISPLTARWVIVKDDSLSARGLYGVDSGKHSRSEVGAFVSSTYIKQISPQLNYRGRLDLYSNYRNNPEKIDVFFSNIFSVKLSRVFSATWNLDIIYDDDVRTFGDDGKSPAVQLKSLVGLGLLVKWNAKEQ